MYKMEIVIFCLESDFKNRINVAIAVKTSKNKSIKLKISFAMAKAKIKYKMLKNIFSQKNIKPHL